MPACHNCVAGARSGGKKPDAKKAGAALVIPKPINLPSRRKENNGFDPGLGPSHGPGIASGWRPADPTEGRPTIREVILSLPKIRPHGGDFDYRSSETDMVAWVMERVAGSDLATLLGTRIWQHIGASRDANFTVDAEATALADGGFNATLRDYARLGQLVVDGGRTGDLQLVPQAWIDQMRTGDPSVFGPPWSDNFPNGAYRRFWWIRDADRGDICARGVFGQFIYVDPESDLVIALVSSWPDYLIAEYTRNTMRAFDAIRDALGA